MSASYRSGLRGRHKRHGSPEARRWAELAGGSAWLAGQVDGRVDAPQARREAPVESKSPAPPPRPSWMPAETYRELARLRGEL